MTSSATMTDSVSSGVFVRGRSCRYRRGLRRQRDDILLRQRGGRDQRQQFQAQRVVAARFALPNVQRAADLDARVGSDLLDDDLEIDAALGLGLDAAAAEADSQHRAGLSDDAGAGDDRAEGDAIAALFEQGEQAGRWVGRRVADRHAAQVDVEVGDFDVAQGGDIEQQPPWRDADVGAGQAQRDPVRLQLEFVDAQGPGQQVDAFDAETVEVRRELIAHQGRLHARVEHDQQHQNRDHADCRQQGVPGPLEPVEYLAHGHRVRVVGRRHVTCASPGRLQAVGPTQRDVCPHTWWVATIGSVT